MYFIKSMKSFMYDDLREVQWQIAKETTNM